ncbi:MAG TPA: EVE domain-containing protein [Steroidobacteraceae bacterium]|nr:EVE domain-containing protein [Steroidobacteraceae bacterium]
MNYWLMKSEPDTFGIDHLARAPRRTAPWDGVLNYQARNFLRDGFAEGDRAFFHHSSCDEPGIYGTMEIVRAGHPEAADPRWYQVDVRLLRKFAHPVTLAALREHAAGPLRDLIVLRRGNRLSVMPVTADEWKFIHRLARERPE